MKEEISDIEAKYNLQALRDGQAKKPFEPTVFHATTDKQREYMKKVAEVPAVKSQSFDQCLKNAKDAIESRRRYIQPCDMSFEEAKYIFWKIFKEGIEKSAKDFVIDGNLIEVLPELIKYHINDESGALPLLKGIYLYGGVGIGKTNIIRSLQSFCNAILFKKFSVVNIPDLAYQIKVKKDYSVLEKYDTGRWCFDDLGADSTVSTYGNSDDISKMLISNWYEHQHRQNIALLATGNEAPDIIFERYNDNRFADRFTELFTPVLLTGKSKRK